MSAHDTAIPDPDTRARSVPLTPSRENHLTVLAIVLGALFLARLVTLLVSPLGLQFDEAQYWSWSQHPAFGYFTKPPLIAWLIGATTAACGDSAACVRFPAMLLHTGSAILCYLLGRSLYDWTVGFWSAIAYATLPAVAFSSFVISTDVPLLFLWMVALVVFEAHVRKPGLATGILLGIAIGIGLNAKYAMVFFALCAVLYLLATRPARSVLLRPSTWLAGAIALLLIAPNLVWNAKNGSATFKHLYKDNMQWEGASQGLNLHPKDMLEFLGSQFGLLGPVIFGTFLVAIVLWRKTEKPAADRFLYFFSIPVFLLILGQALMSGAEANWAATAFPAVLVLATAHLVQPRHRISFLASLAINGGVALLITVGLALASQERITGLIGSTHQFFTSDEMRAEMQPILNGSGVTTVVTESRIITAEMVYAMRNTPYEVRVRVNPEVPPHHGFEMDIPWTPDGSGPVAYVRAASKGEPENFDADFERLGTIDGASVTRNHGRLAVWRATPKASGAD